MRLTWILSAAALFASAAAGTSKAQTIGLSHPAGEVAHLLRTQGRTGPALSLLSQSGGRLPRDVLDAIADSLVVIAIESSGEDTASTKIRQAVRTTLVLAGTGERGIVYQGAAERLFRLAMLTKSAGAACALAILPDEREALTYLTRLAAMDHGAAHGAVNCMADEMGPAGLAALRTLHTQGVVTQKYARMRLDGLARRHGWR